MLIFLNKFSHYHADFADSMLIFAEINQRNLRLISDNQREPFKRGYSIEKKIILHHIL